jgi:hypothetical protein
MMLLNFSLEEEDNLYHYSFLCLPHDATYFFFRRKSNKKNRAAPSQ